MVIVLAQPDDRYFYGLRGRYLFSMHFRVYKEGTSNSRWIVRSMHNSGNESVYTRSVSAEINDLEPGTYDVIFKVTATRIQSGPTAEEAITKYAADRKEKLLHVGRRFDYAQTKGNLRNMEKEVRMRKRDDGKRKMRADMRKSRQLNQQDRERARARKKRVDEAMREKRKAFEMKQKEKAKAREQRAIARQKKRALAAGQQQADPSSSSVGGSTMSGKAVTPTSNLEQSVLVENPNPAAAEMQSQMEEEKTKAATGDGEIVKTKEDQEAAETKTATADPEAKDPKEQALSQQLGQLNIQEKTSEDTTPATSQPAGDERPISPLSDDDESEYDSPIEPPEELEDDDFDWDSEM